MLVFPDAASPEISCLNLRDALPIAGVVPGTLRSTSPRSLPLLSTFHTQYRSAPACFQATSYPLAVFSAPIGSRPAPNCPATTGAPPNFSTGPEPPLPTRDN